MERLDRRVVRKLFCHVSYNNPSALDARRFEDDAHVIRVARGDVMRNAVVADEWCSEDEDLTPIGRVRHRLGI
jgi:hypothetical protein